MEVYPDFIVTADYYDFQYSIGDARPGAVALRGNEV